MEGKSYSQPIVVKQDPRVKTPALEMQQVYALTSALYFGAADAQAAASTLGAHAGPAHRDVVSGTGCRRRRRSPSSRRRRQRWKGHDQPVAAAGGGAWRPRSARAGSAAGRGNGPRCLPPTTGDTLWATVAALTGVMNAMQAADVAPTTNTLNAIAAAQASAARVMARWNTLRTIDLPALNVKLKAAGAEAVK